jgi:hypothetical protein
MAERDSRRWAVYTSDLDPNRSPPATSTPKRTKTPIGAMRTPRRFKRIPERSHMRGWPFGHVAFRPWPVVPRSFSSPNCREGPGVPNALTPAVRGYHEPQSRRCGVIAAWCGVPPARRKREWPCNGRAHEFGAHEPRYVVDDDKHVRKCDKLVIQISGALCMVGHRFSVGACTRPIWTQIGPPWPPARQKGPKHP